MTEIHTYHSHVARPQLLRRIRRNRFWLLLYLWIALLVPALVLREYNGETFPSGLALILFTLTSALALFILCTAIPSPKVSFSISAAVSLLWFLFCGFQLVYHSIFGTFTLSPEGVRRFFRYRAIFRAAVPEFRSRILLMGIPSLFLLAFGRLFFSFRPLKSWKQHIPMVTVWGLSTVISALCLFWPASSTGELSVSATETISLSQEETAESTAIPANDIPGFQVPEMNFDALAARENRDDVARIHRYFAGRTASAPNEKTGLFQGCNLIQLAVTLSNPEAFSEELAPTLFGMMKEGFLLSDFQIPRWEDPVRDGDYTMLTGILPSGSPDDSIDNYMPLTMVQQLISRGYSAWALHCCDGGSCSAARLPQALGYECAASASTLREALDRTIGNCTDHAPFTLYGSLDALCDVQALEEAMSLLVTRLDQAEALDHTVIVLTLDFSGAEERQSQCILWKPGIAAEAVDTPTGPLDLLPTLSNLFGVSFDSRLYMGRDVFGDDTPLVLFPDGGWITDLASYDAESGNIRVFIDQPLPEGYCDTISRDVRNKIAVCAMITDSDYWRILFP